MHGQNHIKSVFLSYCFMHEEQPTVASHKEGTSDEAKLSRQSLPTRRTKKDSSEDT